MKLKQSPFALVFASMAVLLPIGLTACTSSSPESKANNSEPSAPAPAESSMAGMDHGSETPMDIMNYSADLGPKDESFDVRFIDAMIPHHQKMVRMAQDALQKSNRPEVQQFAQALIDAQEREILQMQRWRTAWYPTAGDDPMVYDAKTGQTVPMPAAMTTNEALGDADNQFDLRFIEALMPHLEGGIDMAQQVLQNSDRPEMKQLAQAVIESQQQEIDRIEQWKQQWYGQ